MTRPFLCDACLILEPHLDGSGRRKLLQRLGDSGGEVFLNVAIACASCAGCRSGADGAELSCSRTRPRLTSERSTAKRSPRTRFKSTQRQRATHPSPDRDRPPRAAAIPLLLSRKFRRAASRLVADVDQPLGPRYLKRCTQSRKRLPNPRPMRPPPYSISLCQSASNRRALGVLRLHRRPRKSAASKSSRRGNCCAHLHPPELDVQVETNYTHPSPQIKEAYMLVLSSSQTWGGPNGTLFFHIVSRHAAMLYYQGRECSCAEEAFFYARRMIGRPRGTTPQPRRRMADGWARSVSEPQRTVSN